MSPQKIVRAPRATQEHRRAREPIAARAFPSPMRRAALFFALAAGGARALFFNVQQGQSRCFIEEMPGATLLVASYKNPDFKPYGTPGFTETGVAIRVVDPAGAPVLQRTADTEGKVSFISSAGGEYQLCFSSNNTRWSGGSPQKFVRRRASGNGLARRGALNSPPPLPVAAAAH